MKLKRINYEDLSAHQRGNYNFFKIASLLSDYGYSALSRSFNYQSDEFIAMHLDGKHMMRVQPATCLSFWKKHVGRNIYVIFSKAGKWYFYPHDKLYREVKAVSNFERSKSFRERGRYVFVYGPAVRICRLMEKYVLE